MSVLLVQAAWGCLCNPGEVRVLMPEDGAVGQPVNARVFIHEHLAGVGTIDPEGLRWRTGGGPDEKDAEWEVYGGEGSRALQVWSPEEFPPETTVELVDAEGDVLSSFATGEGRDDVDPTWGGEYTGDSRTYEDCDGTRVSVSFEFFGAEDDFGGELAYLLSPLSAGWTLLSTGPIVGSTYSDVCGGNEAIRDGDHRAYQLVVFDQAGNALDGGTIEAPRCGCAFGSARGWPLALAALALASMRRSPCP